MALPKAQRDLEVTRAQLSAWLAGKLPDCDEITVSPISLPENGFSNETLSFDAECTRRGEGHRIGLVARIQPDGHQYFHDADVFLQWRAMAALAEHTTVPVPHLRWAEPDRSVLGSPFFVMDRVDARVPPDRPSMHEQGWVTELTGSERRAMVVNGLRTLADLHRADWRPGFEFLLGDGPGEPGLDRYLHWVERWYSWVVRGRPHPLAVAALAYLRKHQPASPPVSVLWGDARLGNMMFDRHLDVAAVLDWEMAALGPPEVDLGWWLMQDRFWSEGRGLKRLPGFPDRDEAIAIYEGLLGRPLGDLRYYDVLACLRLAIVAVVAVPDLSPDWEKGFRAGMEQSSSSST